MDKYIGPYIRHNISLFKDLFIIMVYPPSLIPDHRAVLVAVFLTADPIGASAQAD